MSSAMGETVKFLYVSGWAVAKVWAEIITSENL
jgi:hypothetical protein